MVNAQTVKIEPCQGPNSPVRSVRTSLVSDLIVSSLLVPLFSVSYLIVKYKL